MRVQDLSLRRPTLDDVFLSVTGERIAAAGNPEAVLEGVRGPPTTDRRTPRLGSGGITASTAGFGRDLVSVATRALRQIPREPEAVIPALMIPSSSSW